MWLRMYDLPVRMENTQQFRNIWMARTTLNLKIDRDSYPPQIRPGHRSRHNCIRTLDMLDMLDMLDILDMLSMQKL
jgi:hypothetical protein